MVEVTPPDFEGNASAFKEAGHLGQADPRRHSVTLYVPLNKSLTRNYISLLRHYILDSHSTTIR